MTASNQAPESPCNEKTVLSVEHLVKEYYVRGRGTVQAVSDVSFDVKRGETLGIVGESGCGKSTVGMSLLMLSRPTSGTINFDGSDISAMGERELREVRRSIQMVFQDPIGSLNPRRRIREIVAEGLGPNRRQRDRDKVDAALIEVGLDPHVIGRRRPHQLSGGQCQRVVIARALLMQPSLVVWDEPVSALDVSVQAQILNLIREMRKRYTLTSVFIAHDLAVVKNISDRVAVMYLGKLCEVASVDEFFKAPRHPYSIALLQAVPVPDPSAVIRPMLLHGELPSPFDPPSGCRFRTRCPRATDLCAAEEPALRRIDEHHFVACHFPEEPRRPLPAEPHTQAQGDTP